MENLGLTRMLHHKCDALEGHVFCWGAPSLYSVPCMYGRISTPSPLDLSSRWTWLIWDFSCGFKRDKTEKTNVDRTSRQPSNGIQNKELNHPQSLVGKCPLPQWRSCILTAAQKDKQVIGFLRGVVIPLMFPKIPQSSLGILRVPQLPPPLEHPPLRP